MKATKRFDAIGEEGMKRIQFLRLEMDTNNPDTLASAVHTIKVYMPNVQQALVILKQEPFPIDKCREKKCHTRRLAWSLRELEMHLPRTSRLKVLGRGDEYFEKCWSSARRPWWVGQSLC